MVSSVPFDILAAPEVAIQQVFDQHSQSSEDFSNVLSNHFKDIFCREERLSLIPRLESTFSRVESSMTGGKTAESSLQIVQFRGMVQDTSASPELYLSRLSGGKYGGWGAHETMDGRGDVDYANLRECTRYWVVSIPGQTQWAGNSSSQGAAPLNSAQNAYKFPLPSTPHIGLSVNVYSAQADVDLKSTDIVTFVGLFESESNTLHVLFHLHESAVQEDHRAYPLALEVGENLEDQVQTLRSELVSWIADESLAGDRDAAEWVLLSVISRVQSRNPPIMPASLTLARFPPPVDSSTVALSESTSTSSDSDTGKSSPSNNIPTLYSILSLLVPIITHVPLSLPLLNDGVFVPESKPRPRTDDADDPEDELHSGILQLAPSTVCLITDSGITEGRINDRGVRSLRALQDVIRNQTLEYVFPYSGFRFETDIGCIVCTEGKHSAFVETHVTVPLKPALSLSSSQLQQRLYKSSAEIDLPPAEKLQAWRKLIGGGIGVSDAASDYIQEEFQRRKNPQQTDGKSKGITTPDDLIHRMLMTKLLALSMHEPEVTVEIWERMKDLEKRRLARVAAV
ncbi:hypothetical protein BT96DRAFT_962714 [Gymnopus androsaceus JB14]|uniref:Mini-chromosome maintenance replisome factor-domain-containing protein n=1 Tax=Gymnopus androsaceus JB14 TaxID=1447944 RepID=A0A6A4IID6_9AGAR|nr:hypothetical protein BT96DRAFT_962714 [Gymnopus androsaceus JB14]